MDKGYEYTKNRCLLELAEDMHDMALLNTPLVNLITCEKGITPKVEQLIADLLIMCRSDRSIAFEQVRSALATAIFMIHSPSTAVCMVEDAVVVEKSVN
jgi:hypothetical protein